jgi:regulator of replication initiation timing
MGGQRIMNLEEVTDELAGAICGEEIVKQIFLETHVPLLIERVRILTNENNFLTLENNDLRNQVEGVE